MPVTYSRTVRGRTARSDALSRNRAAVTALLGENSRPRWSRSDNRGDKDRTEPPSLTSLDVMNTGETPGPGPHPPGEYPGPDPYPTGETVRMGVTEEERNWAMAAHLSSILGVWAFFLGAIGPLVVLLAKGDRSPFIRSQAVEALNFNISVLIYSVVGWVLVLVLIGIPLLGALFVFWLVFTLVATVKVSNGQPYRYPLTIRLVH
jgi:uncharacterized Tic20 family protein